MSRFGAGSTCGACQADDCHNVRAGIRFDSSCLCMCYCPSDGKHRSGGKRVQPFRNFQPPGALRA
eukprot:2473740-Pyramimonas_sp.AAC.1